jgi:transposase
MESKELLIRTIKEWVRLDNEVRVLQKEQALRKIEKKNISTHLMEIMKKNEIDCFDIKDGQICYAKKSIKKPITKKALFDILEKYCKGDMLKATEINNYIIENREEVIKETIVRKIFTPND